MARKLSQLVSHALRNCAWAIAAVSATAIVAQDDASVGAPPPADSTIVENPFFQPSPLEVELEEAEPAAPPVLRIEPLYQSPITARRNSAPLTPPVLPASRFERPFVPPGTQSPIKSAILEVNSVPGRAGSWDNVPTAESLRSRTPFTDSRNPHGSNSQSMTPNTRHDFAPEPLVQPLSITEEPDATSSDIWVDCVVFDDPGFGHENEFVTAQPSPIAPADDEIWPLTPGENDSPATWLAEAQQVARTATSLDEFVIVAQYCERGLACEPPAEHRTGLVQLAAWTHNRRGELLADAGRDQEALAAFETAVTIDAECTDAILNRAITLAQQNRPEEALLDFNRVIELNPRSGLAHRNRAELLATIGRMDAAVADYSKAIEADPNDAELFSARAYAWQRLANFPRARADLDRALQLSPQNPTLLTQRGNLAAQHGSFALAIEDFEQAIGIDPNSAEPHRSLAWLHATCPNERYRDPERALAAAERASALAGPENFLVLDAVAAAQASAGDFVSAVATQQRAIAAAPPQSADPLRARLTLYQHGKPFRSGQMNRLAQRPQQSRPARPNRPALQR